jgi:hypothetical protein
MFPRLLKNARMQGTPAFAEAASRWYARSCAAQKLVNEAYMK